MSTKYLTEGLIWEILTRLPAKSLVRFRGVCKSWRSLISSEGFIGSHLKQQQSHTLTTFDPLISFSHNPDDLTRNFYLARYSNLLSHHEEIHPLDSSFRIHPPIGFENCFVWWIGFCDGIVCLICGETNLMICNPSIRKSTTISAPQITKDIDLVQFGFGHDARNDDYKIVRLCIKDNSCTVEVHVYSLKSRSWKVIVNDLRTIRPLQYYRSGLAGGHIHWVAYSGLAETHVLLSFDLTYEVFRQTELPLSSHPHLMYDILPTATKPGKVSMLASECFESDLSSSVWELGELGEAGSWTELHPTVVRVFNAKGLELEKSSTTESPNGTRRSVIDSFNGTCWYWTQLESERRVVIHHRWLELFDTKICIIHGFGNYVESLVMLNYDNTACSSPFPPT